MVLVLKGRLWIRLKNFRSGRMTSSLWLIQSAVSIPIPLHSFTSTLHLNLRICAMYEAKNCKICNFRTFWPVIQLINHHINRVIDQNIQKLLILAVFASYMACILNPIPHKWGLLRTWKDEIFFNRF